MDNEKIIEYISAQQRPDNYLRDPKCRVRALKALYKNIRAMEAEVCAALQADLNKSRTESYMTEIGLVLSEVSYMIKRCRGFARTRKVHTPLSQFHAKSYVLPSPYGSALVISPWNYPFLLAVEPLVDAIAAGNGVVLKPSELSPNVSAVIEKLIAATFPPEQATVVCGGVEVSEWLLEQSFDYIFYTGGTRVGKIVMQKAAERLIPVTLELGGKSPCIVDETADIPLAAKRIVFGKFLNAGQTCVAPDYLYCARSVKDKLLREIGRQIVLQYSVDPLGNPAYPKLIHRGRFDTVKRFITQSNVLFGGKSDAETLKIEPTVVDSSFDAPEMQEEIFGPVLPVVTFDTVDEAIAKVNAREKPLALYIFSGKKKTVNRVLQSCNFGGGCVNDTIIHLATSEMGFGGVGASGMGAYHGKVGFDTFTHYKSIVDKKAWLDLPMRYQPYSKSKDTFIRWFLH